MVDKLKTSKVKEAFCPTTNMIEEFLTKPLQGRMFRKMRNNILNLLDKKSMTDMHRSIYASTMQDLYQIVLRLSDRRL